MSDKERQKIIIDTDCGIDDALALMLALSNKDIAEVVAISCVFGNADLDQVCSNVMRVLTVCEETKIPIYPGCAGPFIRRKKEIISAHSSDGLGGYAHEFPTGDMKTQDTPASLALVKYAKEQPKQITLVAIGPLTNLAVAHRIDPKFTENLKSIVIMGGNYKGIGNTTEVAEYNFYCDPESAHIVLTEAVCPVTLIPWETTMDYGIEWGLYKELTEVKTKKGTLFKLITTFHADTDIYKLYTDCDVLAVAAAIYPKCIDSTIKYALSVEFKGKLTRGLTVLHKNSIPERQKAEIITSFNMSDLTTLRKKMLL